MEILQVFIHVKPERRDAFIAATRENAANSITEPGVARFDFYQQADDPDRFTLIEIYRHAEAPGLHKQTEHYKKWLETVADMMAEPRSRTSYHALFLKE